MASQGDANVLFLKYEDMQDYIKACIIQIAAFIDVELSDEKLHKVVEVSSFSAMKKNPTTSYKWVPMSPGSTPFIRKGVVGDWKNHFTPEQSVQFDAIYEEKFKSVGLELKFE